ncbi:MAG: WS/DGAT domain-containing protein, partial [Candidatus Sulfotelmatobacter sp.]
SAVQGLAGQMLSQLPITPFNLVCTNVPGPQFPLYLLGHKMLRWYPYVPVGGEMAVNCAVLSYDGNVYFGFSGDVHAAPDLRRLESFVKMSFEELREAARVGRPKKDKTRAKEKAAAKAVPVEMLRASISVPASVLSTESKQEPKLVPLTEQKRVHAQLNVA